jgi:hypothetical protein
MMIRRFSVIAAPEISAGRFCEAQRGFGRHRLQIGNAADAVRAE